jgi:hypothetical protein
MFYLFLFLLIEDDRSMFDTVTLWGLIEYHRDK